MKQLTISFSASGGGGLASAPVDGGSSSSGRAAAAAFHTGVGSAAKLAAEQLYHFTPRDYASSYSHYQVGVLTNQLGGEHRCARGTYGLLMSSLTARICTPPQREKYTPPLKSIYTPPRNPGKIFEIFFNKFYASVVFL